VSVAERELVDKIVDTLGNIRAITVEHASERADLPALDYEQVAAPG